MCCVGGYTGLGEWHSYSFYLYHQVAVDLRSVDPEWMCSVGVTGDSESESGHQKNTQLCALCQNGSISMLKCSMHMQHHDWFTFRAHVKP